MNENEEKEKISDKRMIYLKLFNMIMRWEHENKHSKRYSDKQMQDRIKKQIQMYVKSE